VRVLAIDPGPLLSAAVIYDDATPHEIIEIWHTENEDMRAQLKTVGAWYEVEHIALEMVQSYGMGASHELFDTVLWAGRLVEAAGLPFTKIFRPTVKTCLLGRARGTDAEVRAALIRRFPPTGGGKEPEVGTRNQPGPLWGVTADLWAALAVAVTFTEQRAAKRRRA